MFDENQISAYHNIKAPERIYKRLNKKKSYSFALIAACLVCVIMLGVFLRPTEVSVKVAGQVIENSVIINDGRLRSMDIDVAFELDVKAKTEVSVSKGKLLFNETEQNTLIFEDDGNFVWQVKREDVPCEISISDKSGVKSFTLIYENSKYILRRNEK